MQDRIIQIKRFTTSVFSNYPNTYPYYFFYLWDYLKAWNVKNDSKLNMPLYVSFVKNVLLKLI